MKLFVLHIRGEAVIKLSVIIVSYNHPELLKDCLDSIKYYNDIGDELEVIVSDNSPTYNVFNYLTENYPWVKIIKNDNIGYGAGNNRGVAISSGEYLLFLNPDTILIENIFAFALEKFEDEDLALFGLRLVNRDLQRLYSFFGIDWFGVIAMLKERYYMSKDKFIDGKMSIAGADMFVRKMSFIEAGLFDEKIFMYKEEADLTKRIKLYSKAKKTAYFNEKRIVHLAGATTAGEDTDRMKAVKALNDSDKYYCSKWGMSLKEMIKSRLRISKFKKLVLILMFNYKRASQLTSSIKFYKSQLKLIDKQ